MGKKRGMKWTKPRERRDWRTRRARSFGGRFYYNDALTLLGSQFVVRAPGKIAALTTRSRFTFGLDPAPVVKWFSSSFTVECASCLFFSQPSRAFAVSTYSLTFYYILYFHSSSLKQLQLQKVINMEKFSNDTLLAANCSAGSNCSIISDRLNITSWLDQNETCTNDYCETDDDYITRIEDYLFPSVYEWILIALHCLVFVVGLVGNFLVCLAVYRNHTMRTVTNMFIVNLAIADFLVIFLCLPPTVLWDITETWFMGSTLCKIIPYFQVRNLSFLYFLCYHDYIHGIQMIPKSNVLILK